MQWSTTAAARPQNRKRCGLPPSAYFTELGGARWRAVSAGRVAYSKGRFVLAPGSFMPGATAVPPSDAPGCCSMCGVAVKRGLPMCYHWRMLHPLELCKYGYAARGFFPSPEAALRWAQALLVTVSRRVAARGGTLARKPHFNQSLRCAASMLGDRELRTARDSQERVADAEAARSAATSLAAHPSAFSTDVATAMYSARSLSGTASALTTRTAPPCDASVHIFEMVGVSAGSINIDTPPLFAAEVFHLHSHAALSADATPPRRPGT